MNQGFRNSWDNPVTADSYAKLGFPNTYYLAYRDLPEILSRHVSGSRAIDFGCGSGRSSRFTRDQGFSVTGIDVSEHMILAARQLDPGGDYRLVTDGNYAHLGVGQYDLVQAIFTFDNIPGWENRAGILRALNDLLACNGIMLLLDSTPELYVNEWASFTTKPFPENKSAKTGDIVRDIVLDVEDKSPCEDILWTDADYETLFSMAGLEIEAIYKPLGYEDEPFKWVSETTIPPWVIHVLRKQC